MSELDIKIKDTQLTNQAQEGVIEALENDEELKSAECGGWLAVRDDRGDIDVYSYHCTIDKGGPYIDEDEVEEDEDDD